MSMPRAVLWWPPGRMGCVVWLCAATLAGCYEEEVGPAIDTPAPISNACLDLSEMTPEQRQSPEGLLAVFDCVDSEGNFDALRSPLAYLVNTQFVESLSGVSMGYLDPYFYIPGYLDPLELDENLQGGDLSLTIQSLDALLNDPDDPLGALLDLYVDLVDQGQLQAAMRLGQAYSAYLYANCSLEDCPILDLLDDVQSLEAYQTVQASSEAVSAALDPRVAADLQDDLVTIAGASTSAASKSGDNLLLGLGEAFMVRRLEDDSATTVDDPYVGKTLLEALQQPLCQLMSDRIGDADREKYENPPDETLETMLELSAQMYVSGESAYFPQYLRTLVNNNPSGAPATTTGKDGIDHDGDGYSIAEGDCDDTDPEIDSHLAEILGDLKDNDCDLVVDDPVSSDPAYKADLECDRNNDGVEDVCGIESYDPDCDTDCDGVSPNEGDCNDRDAQVHPGLKVYGSDGSITVYTAGEELEEGVEDYKDNDCDGFTDYVPSSIEILFKTLDLALPLTYASHEGDQTNLDYLVELLASQTSSFDIEAMLESNSELIDSTLSNLSNGLLSPQLTAQMRVTLPVAYVAADMGLISESSMGSILAINDDHEAYDNAKVTAQNSGNTSELNKFTVYADACGEEYDDYVDSLKVLDELVKILDVYQVINEPHLNELLPIVVNSDLLIDMGKIKELSVDDTGHADPEVLEAELELLDYLLKPPADSGLYFDNYAASRIWTLIPMVQLVYETPGGVEELDGLMQYLLDGVNDPDSILAALPDALEALAEVQTGGSVNRDALIDALMSPDGRRILLNALAIAADPDFSNIVMGSWDALPSEVRDTYETEQSMLEFTTSWIKEGVVDAFLQLAGDVLDRIVDSTSLGETTSTEAVESTPDETTPVP